MGNTVEEIIPLKDRIEVQPPAFQSKVLRHMKGATEELFVKVTYYKKREGLGSPQWHFNTYPSVLLKVFFSEKNVLLKKSNLLFSKL